MGRECRVLDFFLPSSSSSSISLPSRPRTFSIGPWGSPKQFGNGLISVLLESVKYCWTFILEADELEINVFCFLNLIGLLEPYIFTAQDWITQWAKISNTQSNKTHTQKKQTRFLNKKLY